MPRGIVMKMWVDVLIGARKYGDNKHHRRFYLHTITTTLDKLSIIRVGASFVFLERILLFSKNDFRRFYEFCIWFVQPVSDVLFWRMKRKKHVLLFWYILLQSSLLVIRECYLRVRRLAFIDFAFVWRVVCLVCP